MLARSKNSPRQWTRPATDPTFSRCCGKKYSEEEPDRGWIGANLSGLASRLRKRYHSLLRRCNEIEHAHACHQVGKPRGTRSVFQSSAPRSGQTIPKLNADIDWNVWNG